jgi:tRNA (cmo5U34)-methyltransferase
MTDYRWNTSAFAEGYDAAAPEIHPYYAAIQDEIVTLLANHAAESQNGSYHVLDLGGGSGRLLERVLTALPNSQATIIDQSEPFLALAERRLARFPGRVTFLPIRLQSDWPSLVPTPFQAVISSSAIHHLEPAEKRMLYQQVYDALPPGGLFLNGDEVRPENNDEYRALMERWADFMRAGMRSGRIPEIFHPAAQGWIDRNVTRFGEPKKSGDDCHETAEAQLGYFRAAGFTTADVPWHRELWSVLRGVK